MAAFAFAGLFACTPEPASTCYAPAPYTYRHEIRAVGELPHDASEAIELPDGRVVAVALEVTGSPPTWTSRAFAIDPERRQVDLLATWSGSPSPMTRLRDGRVIIFRGRCSYVVVDPSDPPSVTSGRCNSEEFSAALVWQDPRGEVLLFGKYEPDGNDTEGAVFILDVEGEVITRLDTRTVHGFRGPPEAPFPLCDGRLLFPRTRRDNDGYSVDAEAVHYYDPATRRLTSLDLSFAPARAAQLDATTALLLSSDVFEPVAQVLDLETQALRSVSPPDAHLPVSYHDTLVGLADGSALTVDIDGTVHLYSPVSESFVSQDLKFSGEVVKLLRLSTGPVLAFISDGQIEIYE